MCIYVQIMPLCGHPPATILSYASCTGVLSQLMRITEPDAWEPENSDKVPFEMGDDCDPRPDNIYVLYSDDYCGWECRNNAFLLAAEFGGLGDVGVGGLLPAYMPGIGRKGDYEMGVGGADHRQMVMGMPGANYGSERLGVGWRTG